MFQRRIRHVVANQPERPERQRVNPHLPHLAAVLGQHVDGPTARAVLNREVGERPVAHRVAVMVPAHSFSQTAIGLPACPERVAEDRAEREEDHDKGDGHSCSQTVRVARANATKA